MELILNTKGDCFLCLKTIPESEKNAQCLRNICRFLQITPCGGLSPGVQKEPSDTSNLLQDTKHNLSVYLCTPCYAVTKRFSLLIHDLEVAQLQVNYCSEVFQKILEKANLTSVSTRKSVHPDTDDNLVVDHLRKKVLQKCSARNKKTLETTKLPLVKLKRLTQETVRQMTKKCSVVPIIPGAVSDDGDDTDSSSDIISSSLYSNDSTVNKYVDNTTSSTTTGVLKGASSQMIEDQSENISTFKTTHQNSPAVQMRKKTDAQLAFWCPTYVVAPPTTAPPAESIDEPVLFNAPSNNTSTAMRKIIRNILIKHCTEMTSGTHYSCGFCKEIIRKNKPSIHLTTHPEKVFSFAKRAPVSDDVFEKLCHYTLHKQVVQCKRLSTSKSNGVLVAPARAHYLCYICKRKCSDSRYLRQHLVICHADVIGKKLDRFQKDERCWTSITNSDYDDDTGNQLKSPKEEANVPCWSALLNPAPPRKKKRKAKADDKQKSSCETTIKCIDTGIVKKREFKYRVLSTQIVSTKSKKESCEDSAVGRSSQLNGVNRKKTKVVNALTMFGCFHCKKSFTQLRTLRFHMINFHPEEIFLSHKPPHCSKTKLADVCRQIFHWETVMHQTESWRVTQKCHHCTKTFRYKIFHLWHLVKSHKAIMAEKINALLEIEEDKVNPVVNGEEEVEDRTNRPGEGSEDNLRDPLGGDEWKYVDEDMMDGSQDCSNESDTKHFPIVVESISIGEPNNCTAAETISSNLCDVDNKYLDDGNDV